MTTTARSGTARRREAGASVAAPSAARPGVVRAALNAPLADYYLVLGAASLLVVFGSMMVLSASSVYGTVWSNDAYFFAKRQAFFLAAGALLAWWISKRDLSTLRWLGWAGILLAGALLLLTFTPLGIEEGGNRNWLRLVGGTTLQPSEFAKVAMVVWGADVLMRKQKLLDQPKHLIVPFVPVTILMIALVLLQKDLGTSMVMMAIFFGILWIVGTPKRVIAAMVGVAAAGVGALVITAPSRLNRILGFLSPDTDHTGVNMQPQQGVYALASGGWWGRGLGKSRAKYGMLSQSHTDYVFAVLGEELGLLGAMGVVLLFGILGLAGLRIAMRSDTLFSKVTAAGITLWFTLQAFINIAVVLRMLPVLGVPLPFVSYGGSALMANLIGLGFLLACARHEPAARRALARNKGKLPRLSTVVDGGRA